MLLLKQHDSAPIAVPWILYPLPPKVACHVGALSAFTPRLFSDLDLLQ